MKRLLIGYVLASISMFTLSAGTSLMPGLDRVRRRVDDALSNKQNGTQSFKDLLAQNGCLSSDGKVLNCTLTASDAKPADAVTASGIEQQMKDLYWANQTEFIDKFCQATMFSREHALAMLTSKLQERYKSSKSPLIAMAQELGVEEQKIDDLFVDLLKLTEQKQSLTSEKRNIFIDKIKELYERRDQYKQLVQKFIEKINALLLAK